MEVSCREMIQILGSIFIPPYLSHLHKKTVKHLSGAHFITKASGMQPLLVVGLCTCMYAWCVCVKALEPTFSSEERC